MTQNRKKSTSMEHEIIVATVVLYLLICSAVLAMHFLQPEGQETVTSSPSPSHGHFSSGEKSEQASPVLR